MDSTRITRHAVALAIALGLTGAAAADAYIGFGSGRAGLEDRILGASTEFKGEDTSEHYFFGFKLSKNVRLEFGRSDLGLMTDTITVGVPTATTVAIDGHTYDLLFSERVGENTALFLRAGVFEWDRESSGPPTAGNRSGSNGHFGVGMSVRISDKFSLRGEYQRFEVGRADVDAPVLALAYHF